MSAKTVEQRPVAAQAQWSAELTELGSAFRRVFRTLNRLRGRDTHLDGGELSHAQFELLIELDEQGELSVGELAAAARLTPATVTPMLDHLAGSGHVERLRSQTDRRVVVSRLTAQGRRQIEAKRLAWRGRLEQALEGVDERELRAATRVLELLGRAFEDGPQGPAGEPPQSASGPHDSAAERSRSSAIVGLAPQVDKAVEAGPLAEH